MEVEKLKEIFPNFSKAKLEKIYTYLDRYNIEDKQKIKHIKNLYRLANLLHKNYINNWHNERKK